MTCSNGVAEASLLRDPVEPLSWWRYAGLFVSLHSRTRSHAEGLPVYLRVGHRRAPGQDLRSDLRRRGRRADREGPASAHRRRDAGEDGLRHRGRRGDDQRMDRHSQDRPQHHHAHRLHRLVDGLRRQHLRRHGGHRGPVARHRPRRRRGEEQRSRAPATRE